MAAPGSDAIAMQQIYIPRERMKALRGDPRLLKELCALCGCKAELDDECVTVEGDVVGEFTAKSVVYAYGRGFEMADALRLAREGNYFDSIDLEDALGSEKSISRIKARIIGSNGKTKRYMEQVSGAKISVYGNTVSFIGTSEALQEARAATEALIKGSMHKSAYARMEALHRRNKEAAHDASF
jgi:ribosomal RNA assembly protein